MNTTYSHIYGDLTTDNNIAELALASSILFELDIFSGSIRFNNINNQDAKYSQKKSFVYCKGKLREPKLS